MIESALRADQLTAKWFETVTAIVAVLPIMVSRLFHLANLQISRLTVQVWMKFFRFQFSALSIHKIKVSTFVVNILEHSLQ
jgi:hypothetical protein